MRFSCDLNVPRTETSTGIPTSWINDREAGAEVGGAVSTLLSLLPPGRTVSDEMWARARLGGGSSLVELVPRMVEAGYLERVDGPEEHYKLVHPARLGPLPEPEPDPEVV